MPLSVENLKVGSRYRLVNFGDVYEFCVLECISSKNFSCKDVHTLEIFNLVDVLRYGIGKDYALDEV